MYQKDKKHRTPFLWACEKNNKKLVELLIKTYPNIIYQKDKKGKTGLQYAYEKDNYEIVEFLISKNSNPEDIFLQVCQNNNI